MPAIVTPIFGQRATCLAGEDPIFAMSIMPTDQGA